MFFNCPIDSGTFIKIFEVAFSLLDPIDYGRSISWFLSNKGFHCSKACQVNLVATWFDSQRSIALGGLFELNNWLRQLYQMILWGEQSFQLFIDPIAYGSCFKLFSWTHSSSNSESFSISSDKTSPKHLTQISKYLQGSCGFPLW